MINKIKFNNFKNKIKKIFFGIFFLFLIITPNNFSFATNATNWYQCTITPPWKIFYQIWSNWKLTFSSFFGYSNPDEGQTDCPKADWSFDSNCTFSWTWWIIWFKLKDDSSDWANWVWCPYDTIWVPSSFSYTSKTESEIKTAINNWPTSQEAMVTAMQDMIYTKKPLVYSDDSEMFFFWWKGTDYDDNWNPTYSDFEWSFYKKWNSSYVYRYVSWGLSLKQDFTRKKKFRVWNSWDTDNLWTDIETDKIWRNNWIVQKIEDWKFLIIWWKSYTWAYKNDVRIFDANKTGPTAELNWNSWQKWMWEKLRVSKYKIDWSDVAWWDNLSSYWCAWNIEIPNKCIDISPLTEQKSETWDNCLPSDSSASTSESTPPPTIGFPGTVAAPITCQITKYKADKFCNWTDNSSNSRHEIAVENCAEKTSEEVDLKDLDELNNKNIIWWSFVNNKLYLILQNSSNFSKITIQPIDFSWNRHTLWTSQAITIPGWFNYNFWQAVNCNSNWKCILAIAWWSKNENIFVSWDCWKDWSEKLNDQFSTWITILIFWSWITLSQNTINLDENIFWTWWIINPNVLIDKNLNIFITSYETKKTLTDEQASTTNLDTCNYTTCLWWDYLRKVSNDFIAKYNNSTWTKTNIKSSNSIQNVLWQWTSQWDQSGFLSWLTKTSENNIFQYPIWKSYIFKEWKQIVNCSVDSNWHEIFFYKKCKKKWGKKKCWSAYLYWKSFLPVEVRSWFWKWWKNWRNTNTPDNYDTNSKLTLSPLQSLKNDNEITFWWTFWLSSEITYLNTIIKEEWEDYCTDEDCTSPQEFKWFTKDFIDNYLKVENRRTFSVLETQWNPPVFYNWDKPTAQGSQTSQARYTWKLNPSLKISFSTWSTSVDSKSWLDFATLISDNFHPISNNWKIQTWSFIFSKKFSPGYHKVHLMFITQPWTKNISNTQIASGISPKSRNQVVLDFAKWEWIWDPKFWPLPSWYNCYGHCSWKRNTPSTFWYSENNWNDELDNYRLQYQAFVYEFYVPEVTNIKDWKIWWTKPSFVWRYTPRDSQLFFYSGSWNTMRLNDIPKNYPRIYTWFTLTWAIIPDDKFAQTSNSELKNIVKLVDNSKLHHKIRPSWNTWDTVWTFNYSPILKFDKNKDDNYFKYFYIDSKWNTIWWKLKKFQTWTWEKITIYNKTILENWEEVFKTDSLKPFIFWNYLPNTELQITILWNSNFKIKTDWEWNFSFQPQKNFIAWNNYFVNFWKNYSNRPNFKIEVSANKKIPEIFSHKNWDIEVSKRPTFFWNWKAWENVNIEVYTENQSNKNYEFKDIKCKNILDSNWKNLNLNEKKSFSWTKILSCSELWETWSILPFSQTWITVDWNWNWYWQLDKDLTETSWLDSKNIYFVKSYYDWEKDKNYDLISFRYLPKKDFAQSFAWALKWTWTWNFLEKIWDNLKITLNSWTWSEINFFDKSWTWTIKIFSWTTADNFDLDFSIKIPPYSWIKFWTWITSTWILVEKWMWIYHSWSWKIVLNQEEKKFHLQKWDKIFSWAKASEIKFSKNLEIFSYWKIKIFPNSWKIFVKFNKNLDFFVNNFDKINLWFFDKIFDYFEINKWWKYHNPINQMWISNDTKLEKYNEQISTILNSDKISSNKNLKLADDFNWKFIKEWEKFLLKWTAWPNTKIKISIDEKTSWSSTTDWSWTFLFYIPKWIKNENYLIGLHRIRLDNIEEWTLSKELFIKIWSQSWVFLNTWAALNQERIFSQKEKWFINFSEKLKKLPIFNW